jgi:hypothetical protein
MGANWHTDANGRIRSGALNTGRRIRDDLAEAGANKRDLGVRHKASSSEDRQSFGILCGVKILSIYEEAFDLSLHILLTDQIWMGWIRHIHDKN